MISIATVVEIIGELKVIKKDLDDNIILETAVVGDVDFIISGDSHLLDLNQFANIKIVTANTFTQLII